MAKPWAEAFYNSPLWRTQREAYRRSVHGICEMCGAPGVIVHHIRELTPDNIDDPDTTLAFDNLQLLCRDCHA
ncbi:MAG: HNH endonuclease, partial [Oscillospiraceae bacterium]|nr:HNH endonuclease [Oscillospiraceae bacterium]